MNQLQALTLSRLSEGKPKPIQKREIAVEEMVTLIYAMNEAEGRNLITSFTKSDFRRKHLDSDRFILVEIPTNKVATPVNRGIDTNLVARISAEAEKTTPIVVDYNFRKIGKQPNGFYPQVILVDGIERLEASNRRGEPRILAWVGCEVADELHIQADHNLSSDDIRQQLSERIQEDVGYNPRATGPNALAGKYPYIEQVYPLENYCIYNLDDKKYRQRYTIDTDERELSLTGKPVEVVQQYVDADEQVHQASASGGRSSLESAMRLSSTTKSTCSACGMQMSKCTCDSGNDGKMLKSGFPKPFQKKTIRSSRESESEESLSVENLGRFFHCQCDGCQPWRYCRAGIHAGGPGSGCTGDSCGRPPGSGHPEDHSVATAVAKKFERYEKMVKAVGDGKINGLAVFGERGIGKSKTVIDTLEKEGKDVTKIKGQITPKELFNVLSQNRDKDSIVWFDDADSAFKDTTSLNIMKAALDSDEPRTISWLSSKKDEGEEQEFRFQGRIIVTTNINLEKNEHVAALTDRMHWINLKLNNDEKMHRIEQVGEKMLTSQGLDKKTSGEVLKWVRDNKESIGDNLSLRVVKKIGDLANIDPDPKEWKELAKSFIDDTNKVSAITPKEDGGSRPSSGKESKGPAADRAPRESKTEHSYAPFVETKGFKAISRNVFEGKKGTITFDKRDWTFKPSNGGKAKTGWGSKELVKHLAKI